MAAPKNDNVKQQILDAAIELFQEQHDVSLAEIAKAAHVSKGTLFYHYRSKRKSTSLSASGTGANFQRPFNLGG
jgi:AcrR family transcriptional regulator